MPYPGRNNIYEATIKRMVAEALEAQEQAFLAEHGEDSQAQLLAYLRDWAQRLGHTPWPREIPGGSLLCRRFGTWETALLAAQLPPPDTPDKTTAFARYQELTQQQKLCYREKKAAKKQRTQQQKAQKEKKEP